MAGEKNYTIEELSEMIVDSVLDENILSKERLIPKMQALIKTLVDLKNIPRNYNAYTSQNRDAKRLRTIEQKDAEICFWRDAVKKLDGSNIEKYYKEALEYLIQKGFRFPPKQSLTT